MLKTAGTEGLTRKRRCRYQPHVRCATAALFRSLYLLLYYQESYQNTAGALSLLPFPRTNHASAQHIPACGRMYRPIHRHMGRSTGTVDPSTWGRLLDTFIHILHIFVWKKYQCPHIACAARARTIATPPGHHHCDDSATTPKIAPQTELLRSFH